MNEDPKEIRRCPLPPVPEAEEDDAGDFGNVFGDQQAIGHQHREKGSRTVSETLGSVRRLG